MPLSLSAAAMRPLEVNVTWDDGTTETVKLPKLRMADFGPWIDELVEQRKAPILADIVDDLPPVDKAQLKALADRQFATIYELREPASKPEGCERVIRMSLKKGGIEGAKADQFIEMLGAGTPFDLAIELSTLWGVPQPIAGTSPNPRSPAAKQGQAGDTSTPPKTPTEADAARTTSPTPA